MKKINQKKILAKIKKNEVKFIYVIIFYGKNIYVYFA